MDRVEKIKAIQRILEVVDDGLFKSKSQAALDALIHPIDAPIHHGKASSFADPEDVKQFNKWFNIYVSQGLSPNVATDKAFAKGDNGIGCWGDSTVEGTGPSCAVSPEDMVEKWGSKSAAKHKLIEVAVNEKQVVCVLKDVMPAEKNKANPAIIDLNPDAAKALGLTPPVMVQASWRWV